MRALTKRIYEWKRHPFTFEVTTFPMVALRLVPKAWYHFICISLKPSLHLSTFTNDKAIILYAIMEDIKFDVGYVIERGIIESTQRRCTRALIHPSLITLLCKMVDVPMSESEEKSPHKLPVPFLKKKNGSS